MVKIVLSKTARSDLKEIVDYIKRDSIKYSFLEKKKIEDAINNLPKQPLSGRIVPELNNEKLRELIFRNYRIIYEIASEKQINILTIHHHARLISNNTAFRNKE
ncbi:type II toxin-antitoxin system RelE/ParE family toxin [Mucilaginibacter sp.]|uniref:type II toxin-antitoxin system RelE/ParE family toxin n=1 Tax=Mucilaginibacter sp. TaxID=1882438 RepID=UPI00263849BC|nr:type II toxin-antitoxin system RelE/ParE family toxin [Mucilaginibacter sp.]MDB4924205.1 ParE toxin of type toxin-antitoxin system, parDE [Mucilaginibacter sp.]